jgi:hypothetical protein
MISCGGKSIALQRTYFLMPAGGTVVNEDDAAGDRWGGRRFDTYTCCLKGDATQAYVSYLNNTLLA